jgi:hypothetical protein
MLFAELRCFARFLQALEFQKAGYFSHDVLSDFFIISLPLQGVEMG